MPPTPRIEAGSAQEKILRYFSEQFLMPYEELEGVNPAKELLGKFPAPPC